MGSPLPAFGFTGTNVAAQRVAAKTAARLITEIARETMAAIRSLVVASIRDGIPPYDAARAIRSMIGMNTQQARAAENYRRDLIDSGLPLDRVDALVDRYVERKIRDRAETIARTEILGSLNEGAREGWREAVKDGLLSEDAVKEWIVTPDDRLCPYCEPMDGAQVPLTEQFKTPLGDVDGPPLHPRCRCAQSVTEPDR
jgi:hypothetical protein